MKACASEVCTLCDDYWVWLLERSPEFATFCGVHRYDHLWDDITVENYECRKTEAEALLARASALSSENLAESEKQNLEFLLYDLKAFVDGFRHKGYYFPANYLDGFHVETDHVFSWMKFKTIDDYRIYVRRLKAITKRMNELAMISDAGIKVNMVTHMASVEDIPEQLDTAIKAMRDGSLLKPFKEPPADIPKDILTSLEDEVKQVVDDEVIPAYQKYKAYVLNTYMKHVRASPGMSTLADGQQFYQACLDYHLSISMTPQEIHELGLQEVDRILGAMKRTAEEEGNEGDLGMFMKELSERKEFMFTTADELLSYVQDLCYNQIRPALPKLFKDIPDTLMKIEPLPAVMANAPVGFYYGGTYDGARQGVYYLNTSKLDALPKYQLTALSLHEGEPGHHFQSVYTFAQKCLHPMRLYMEDMKYYVVPTKRPMHSANVEGWGLYSEALGKEMGLYKDNYSLLGRYGFEFHRAARLVVDTGLHAMGWTAEEALKYLAQSNIIDYWQAKNEIKRYITIPGQACAYKVGELKLWDLRKSAETKLGDRFEVHDFHSVILSCGPISLPMLDTLVNQYIQQTLKL